MTGDETGPRRRDVLAGVGLSIGGVALAGCEGLAPDESDGRATTASRTSPDESPTASDDVTFAGIAPQPLRNKQTEGRSVNTATGEFTPVVTDFDTPGRGDIAFSLTRKYRSALADETGLFGRGWTWTYDKRVQRDGEDVLFETGRGERVRFEPAETEGWTHPQFYAVFVETEAGLELQYADGTRLTFESTSAGGRLRSIADPSGNAYRFSYDAKRIRITTPRDATVVLRTNGDGLVTTAETPWGETWQYRYSDSGTARLTAVVRPDGSTIRYRYDDAGRLAAIRKPGDETPYLELSYEQVDGAPRVVRQRHGDNGGTFDFWYERVGRYRVGDAVYPVYRTHVARKGQGQSRDAADLHLSHAPAGLVTERVVEVDTAELAPAAIGETEQEAGTAGLTTETTYNDHLEPVERTFPAGNARRWRYQTDATDPRARGNLTALIEIAAPDRPGTNERAELQIEWTDVGEELPIWRRTGETDPDGNRREFAYDGAGRLRRWRIPDVEHYNVTEGLDAGTTRAVEGTYAYNEYGQLVRREEWGAVTEYEYYETAAYEGPRTVDGHTAIDTAVSEAGGGLLARVQLDAGSEQLPQQLREQEAGRIRTGFVYDRQGNVTARVDGEGNVARIRRDALGHATATIDRTGSRQTISRDAMGNVTAITHAFDRNQADGQTLSRTTSERTVFWEYNQLDNVTAFGRRSEGTEHRVRLDRDANENVVARHRGDRTVRYRYGDRNLLIEQTWAPGTADEATQTFRYARDGKPVADTDGNGNTIRRSYGGLRRLRTTEFPNGLIAHQSHSQAGYLDQVQFRAGDGAAEGCLLGELRLERDAATRVTRATRRRISPPQQGCEPLGESEWDGESGAVTRAVEYTDAGPKRIWEEPGAVTTYRYDDAGRLLARTAPAGTTTVLNYDARNALTRAVRFDDEAGATDEPLTAVDPGPHYQESRILRDRKARPTGMLLNGEPKHEVDYNAIDQVVRAADAEQQVWPLHDAVGRTVGSATRAGPSRASGEPDAGDGDLIVRRRELDALDRTRAVVDPEGGRTRVRYDRRNNPTEIRYPDGATETAAYDPAGNLREWTDPGGTTFSFEYDALNNLTAETAETETGSRRITYDRDHRGRLRTATDGATGITVDRRHDSLGNRVRETVDGRTLTREYNSAGNVTRLRYPEGPDVRNAYDELSRLTAVETGNGDQVWRGRYDAEFLEDEVYGEGVMQARTSYETDCTAGCVGRRRFEDANGETLGGAAYQYAPDGTLTGRTWLRPGEELTDEFDHDTTKRLTRVAHGLGHTVTYGHSRLDTIEAATVQGADGYQTRDLAPSTDANYQPATFGSARFSHDVNLNRRAETGHDVAAPEPIESACASWEYEYDAWNRLVTARCLGENDDVRRRIEWTYDPLNRPVRKTVTEGETQRTERYAWADQQMIKRWTTRGVTAASGGAVAATGTTSHCDTVTTLLYGRTLAEIITDTDDSEEDDSETSDDDSNCPTGDWFVIDDGKGNNIGAVDSGGRLDEEVVYDGAGMPVQTVTPDEIGRHDRVGRIDISRFPTLDAGGSGVFDLDIAPVGRENHFGNVVDPRNQGVFGGRRGRDGAGITTGVEDLGAEFGLGSQQRAGGRRAWTGGTRRSGGNQTGGIQVAGVSGEQVEEGAAMAAKAGGKALENDGSSKTGKQKGPNVHNGVGVSGTWGPGGVDADLSVTIFGWSINITEIVEKIFGGASGDTGTSTAGTSGTTGGSTSSGNSSSGRTSSGEGAESGDQQGEDSTTDENETKEESSGDKESQKDKDDEGNGSDETKEDSEDDTETDQESEGENGDDTGTSESTNADEKGSNNSTPTPSSGPGGCGPTMMCRGTGAMRANLPGQSRGDDERGPCGPAMLCRGGDDIGGQVFGIGVGGGGGGPDCRRMICRVDDAVSGPFARGAAGGKPGVCRYAMCRDGGLTNLGGMIDILGTQVGATAPRTHLDVFAPTGPAQYQRP